jgi:hypothetical protein
VIITTKERTANNINPLLILIIIILLLIIAYLVYLTVRIGSLGQKEDVTPINSPSVNNDASNNILAILEEIRDGSQKVMDKSEKFHSMTEEFDKQISLCIQKVGINSSDNKEDLALALLNKHGDGVVISFSKNNFCVKSIEKGHSPVKLTKKEEEAIDSALN